MTLIFGVCESFLTLLLYAFYLILHHFAERKDFVGGRKLRSLVCVSLALGQFAAERLTTTDTRLNRCYVFQKSLVVPCLKSAWIKECELLLTASSEVESRDGGVKSSSSRWRPQQSICRQVTRLLCSTETPVWSHPSPCFCWEPVSLINTICQKRQLPTRNIYRQVESPAPHAHWRKQKDLPPLTVWCQSGSCQSRKHEAVKAHRTGLSSRTGSPLPKRNLKYLKLN